METINLGRVAFVYKGDYSALTAYNKMDVVFDGESSFVSQIDNNVGNELVNGLNWKYLSRGNNLELQEAKQDIAALETYWKIMSKGFEPTHGTTEQRPVVNLVGAEYFDTTLSKPIWHNGTNWIDALGTIV